FGHGELKLIDRQRPAQSLLLQYAMPGSMAESDHPEVANFRPPLRGVNDARYRQLLEWIGQTLQPVEPDYGFEFKTPATQPSMQPASKPTTRPASAPMTKPAMPAGKAPAPRPTVGAPRVA